MIRRFRIPPPPPPPQPPTPMKGPAIPHLGVILSFSGNYVFSFLRNLDTDGHSLIAFICNGKSFFASGKMDFGTILNSTNVESARQDWTVLIQN